MPEIHNGIKLGLIIGSIVLAIIIIVISMSFGFLEYYQYGFKRQKSTSRVFTDYVYKGGRHFIGPDFDFKVYPASANGVQLKSLTVFTKDTLEVYIDVEFQYFLRPSQLAVLHKKYQLTYNSVIRSSAMDALKAAAATYTTEQFIKDRIAIENAMENAVRLRIGGKCCEEDCLTEKCLPGCIPLTSCTDESQVGLMVNMRYFVITRIRMPTKVYQRYLKALLLVEESQMEKYRLDEAVVKKEVDEMVKAIGNQAFEVAQNSSAEAQLISRKATAEELKIVGASRSEGLNLLMTTCGLTDPQHKMSFHYLNMLGTHKQAHMAVDFKNYVVGGK